MEEVGSEICHLFVILLSSSVISIINFELLAGVVTLVLLTLFSGAISATEIAFFSLSDFQIDSLKRNDTQQSKIVLILLEHPKRLLATIIIANILINVAVIILASFFFLQFFGITNIDAVTIIFGIAILSAFILLFGEIIPKIYASSHNLKVASVMSRPLLIAQQLLYPLSSLLVNYTGITDNRSNNKGHNITIDELSEALELTEQQSISQNEERKILKGIIKFGDIAAREIMRPRVDVTAANDTSSFTELLTLINESGYSRIPIYNEDLDNITGILYIKDLIPHIHESATYNWQKLQRQAFFVPENKKINDLLHDFQTKKIHLAIVVDEYGGTSGIITLEDILEEIVGEINDEFDSDVDEIHYSKIDNNTYIFEGKTLLNDFCKVIGIDDRLFQEVKGESDTLAGLVLELAGTIPGTNEHFSFGDFTFKPEVVDKRSIKRIRVTIKERIEE